MPGAELRVLIGYVLVVDVEKDGLVRPDELLQLLHAIPMAHPNGASRIVYLGLARTVHMYIYTHRI